MKIIFLIISLLAAFFVNNADAACTGTSPTWTCTADSTSAQMQSCINSASPGDTINVGAGSGTWSNISITKGINLIGAGIGNTVITAGTCTLGMGAAFIRYNPSNYTLDTPFRISGFSFNGNNSCGVLELGINSRSAPFTVQTKLRIDHNRFYGKSGVYIWDRSIANGVVDHNIFDGGDTHIRSIPGADYQQGWWTTSPQNIWAPGTGVGLYMENNTFNLTSSASNLQLTDTYESGGKYIYRYNLITSTKEGQALFDMHGNQSVSNGSFGGEIYGNRIEFASSAGVIYKTRGGSSFIFNNSILGTGASNVAYMGSLDLCPAAQYNPGQQMVHDTYFWGTRYNYTGSLISSQASGSGTCDGLSNRPMFGRDVIADSSTPGVTAGTLANRPASCTVGQGYWATNQSTTNLTSMVGIEPSTPISGTLYKCTATDTWTSFYTPYTYPHPLTAGGPPPPPPPPMREPMYPLILGPR